MIPFSPTMASAMHAADRTVMKGSKRRIVRSVIARILSVDAGSAAITEGIPSCDNINALVIPATRFGPIGVAMFAYLGKEFFAQATVTHPYERKTYSTRC